jgi:Protein of unknown function (DUF1360)
VTATDLPGTAGEDYAAAAEHRPLGGYAVLSAALGTAVAGGLAGARGKGLPERLSLQDIVLAGVATHKLSRLLAKDKVTSFIRAPFTEFQEPSGKGEIEETPRGRGLRLATGELLVCPYCVAQWIAAGFAVGYVHAPRLTRFFAGLYTMYAVSDGLQIAYLAAEERA